MLDLNSLVEVQHHVRLRNGSALRPGTDATPRELSESAVQALRAAAKHVAAELRARGFDAMARWDVDIFRVEARVCLTPEARAELPYDGDWAGELALSVPPEGGGVQARVAAIGGMSDTDWGRAISELAREIGGASVLDAACGVAMGPAGFPAADAER